MSYWIVVRCSKIASWVHGVSVNGTYRVQSLHGGMVGPLCPGDGLGVPVGHRVHVQVAGDADQEEEEIKRDESKEE